MIKLIWQLRKPKKRYSEFDSITKKLAAINGIEDIDKFLNPQLTDTYSYTLLKNIDVVIPMVASYVLAHRKTTIFADCDQDGCEAAATIYRYLKNFTNNLEIIHAQRDDGHGLEVAEDIIPDDTELLLIVDSSTNSIESCKIISSKGIPIIIIDHHDWDGVDNPYATIINPKMPNCTYPNRNASGTLVTYKVCKALDEYLSTDYADKLMDLAGFSLLADSMSALEPENRYYIKLALENVTNLGMRVLLDTLKIDVTKFNSIDFLYSVAPCITAITRLGELEVAIQLLISDDIAECEKLCKRLLEANEIRKRIQRESVALVKHQINPDDKCIVVVESSIGKSFNGVVAQELVSLYKRPAIVLGASEKQPDRFSGSYRSYASFDMRAFLKQIDSAIFAAGHDEAGGTACYKDQLDKFKREINHALREVHFDQSIVYDLEFEHDDITESLINEINNFYKVSGKDVDVSNFLVKDMMVLNKKVLGSGKDTIKAELYPLADTWFLDDLDELKPTLIGMKFKTDPDYIEEFPVRKSIDIVGNMNVNEWRVPNTKRVIKTLQIFIEDYQVVN